MIKEDTVTLINGTTIHVGKPIELTQSIFIDSLLVNRVQMRNVGNYGVGIRFWTAGNDDSIEIVMPIEDLEIIYRTAKEV